MSIALLWLSMKSSAARRSLRDWAYLAAQQYAKCLSKQTILRCSRGCDSSCAVGGEHTVRRPNSPKGTHRPRTSCHSCQQTPKRKMASVAASRARYIAGRETHRDSARAVTRPKGLGYGATVTRPKGLGYGARVTRPKVLGYGAVVEPADRGQHWPVVGFGPVAEPHSRIESQQVFWPFGNKPRIARSPFPTDQALPKLFRKTTNAFCRRHLRPRGRSRRWVPSSTRCLAPIEITRFAWIH